MAWGTPEVAAVAAPAPALTPEQFAEVRNAKIREWLGVAADLAQAKETEMRLRKELTAMMFPDAKKGTQRHEIGEGYNIKLEYKLNHKLGEADKVDDRGEKISIASQVSSLEDEIIGSCTEGEFLATRLIKWTPALVVSEYDKLAGDNGLLVKKLIDKLLTIEPAAPSLTFEPPKESK
jgi:hypothetical protein